MAHAPSAPNAEDVERLRLERDLLLRLLDLGTAPDLPPFLEGALALVVEITQASKGYLQLDAEGGGAPFWIAHGFSDAEIDGVRRAISTGIVAQAIATGRTISTANAALDPRFASNESVQAGKIQAVLCAPVTLGVAPGDANAEAARPASRALGVVYVEGRKTPGPFPEASRQLAELFARCLAPLADRALAREAGANVADHTAELRARLSVDSIAGSSRALAEVFRQIAVAAPVPIAVLITGESGTGKTAVAEALHASSPRARGPFVSLNCAAIPEALFESELFGAEKGAHSTALKRSDGLIEAARKGTLFLDEVGEMPFGVQSKLLTFLQSKRYYRLGGTVPIEADVRVVAATNADLEELAAQRRFREDLYYRLAVLEVHVPALRERRDDVPPIADAIAKRLGEHHGRAIPLSRAAKIALSEGAWPGNVRQLENAVQRGWAVALSEGATTIEPRHVFPERESEGAAASAEVDTYEDSMRRFQARFLREALEKSGWNVSETARRAGIARSHLNDLIKVHGLTRAKK